MHSDDLIDLARIDPWMIVIINTLLHTIVKRGAPEKGSADSYF